ncbi:MAG: hypothetical protein LUG18_06185 [Candidatus Azobacteroides sp.]|nr:hypothetical protein [Candidatus Azobacteroides sp.]
MDLKKDIIEQTKKLQEFIIDKVAKKESTNSISIQDVRLINEALFALSAIFDYCKFEPHNKVLLQKTYRLGLDIVYEELFYYAGYYYSYKGISKGNIYEKQSALFKVNVNTATAISVFEGYKNGICEIGGSTDDYYIERMERVFWGLNTVLKSQREEIMTPSLYVIYNLSQSLSVYLKSGHKAYKENAIRLLREILNIQEKFHSLSIVKQILLKNIKLNLFNLYQFSLANEVLDLKQPILLPNISSFNNYTTENILRILSSIFYFDKKLFIEIFEHKYSAVIHEISINRVGLNNFLFLKCLILYYSITGNQQCIDFSLLPLQKNKIDFSDYINTVFHNYYQSATVILEPEELKKLLEYNDDTLREKVANTIIGVDPNILIRESKKPHGASEISDMEIPIKLSGQSFYMCMPFKSGIEISGNSVPENIAYQIFRPFLHFDNCIVVFITAKKSSQNLMNYIKRMQSKLGWNITVIENEGLAKLLKINNQLN